MTGDLPSSTMTERLLPAVPEGDENKKGRLLNIDFWPACTHADQAFTDVQFERFDTLLPKANAWLRANQSTEVVKCETLEKKITAVEQLANGCVKFDAPQAEQKVYYVKGLRLWYSSSIPAPPSGPPRRHAQQVGYRSLVPRVVDCSTHKYPLFEDLSSTYSRLNDNLIDRPLEGRILSVETVSVKLPRTTWEGPDIQVDQCQWEESPKYHVLYIVRIYYVFECPYYEQVGAADFLPDTITDSPGKGGSGGPKYADFGSLMRKINTWLDKVKDIRITNIQTLEAAVPGADKPELETTKLIYGGDSLVRGDGGGRGCEVRADATYTIPEHKACKNCWHSKEKANTSLNFIPKADTMASVRFLRVTYVRPKYGLPPGGLYAPKTVSYCSFVPKPAAGDAGEFEPETCMLDRMRTWLEGVENRLLGIEMLYHPLPLLERKKDCGDSTLMKGTWYFPPDSTQNSSAASDTMQRLPCLQIVRLYFEGPLDIDKRSELHV